MQNFLQIKFVKYPLLLNFIFYNILLIILLIIIKIK